MLAMLGLTRSLNQSGESETQDAITKTGSTLARRLLIEAAWHYTPRPLVGPTNRQSGQPGHVIQIAAKPQHRGSPGQRAANAVGDARHIYAPQHPP